MYVLDCSDFFLPQTSFSVAIDWQTKGVLHLLLKESTWKGKDRKITENTDAQILSGPVGTKLFHAHFSLF